MTSGLSDSCSSLVDLLGSRTLALEALGPQVGPTCALSDFWPEVQELIEYIPTETGDGETSALVPIGDGAVVDVLSKDEPRCRESCILWDCCWKRLSTSLQLWQVRYSRAVINEG
jgi:hypothetical protein